MFSPQACRCQGRVSRPNPFSSLANPGLPEVLLDHRRRAVWIQTQDTPDLVGYERQGALVEPLIALGPGVAGHPRVQGPEDGRETFQRAALDQSKVVAVPDEPRWLHGLQRLAELGQEAVRHGGCHRPAHTQDLGMGNGELELSAPGAPQVVAQAPTGSLKRSDINHFRDTLRGQNDGIADAEPMHPGPSCAAPGWAAGACPPLATNIAHPDRPCLRPWRGRTERVNERPQAPAAWAGRGGAIRRAFSWTQHAGAQYAHCVRQTARSQPPGGSSEPWPGFSPCGAPGRRGGSGGDPCSACPGGRADRDRADHRWRAP